ncbi:hypothetical protein WJX81_005839 [Elliptochloris bilobata]|uniref:AB hydrolase-1 domain-containing protein n=1 Tax=Elliptochloris bilobata TaxID=381761 RepID=A0AAW1S502_9CHLO
MSWPSPDALQGEELRLSIDTWTEQLKYFVENVVGMPCFVAGNSLGGLLAASFATACPELCRGVCYLNATPFWSVMPRLGTPSARALRSVLRWDGALPAPEPLKRAVGRAWAAFAQEDNVRATLEQVYSHKAAADDDLVNSIMEAARHPLALDAIASIILSPRSARPFGQLAAAAAAACPACLIYGKEDPWVVPLWGQRLRRLLPADTAYYEVSPAGHCPHHEAPEAVYACLADWMAAQEASRKPYLAVGEQLTVDTQDGRRIVVTHVAGEPRTLLERAETALYKLRRRLGRQPDVAAEGS